MQPNTMQNQNPVPTHKHLALWTISFIALLVIALLFWGWTSRNPVGGEMIEKYNSELNTNIVENTQNNTQNSAQTDPATQALENDINSSLDLEVESDLKSIDLEF